MSDTVWVGYHDGGSEGCSIPLRVFENKELAELWKVGANDNYASGAEIIEMPLIRSPSNTETPT